MADISSPLEVDVYLVHLVPDTDYSATVSGAETSSASVVGEKFTLPDPSIIVVDPMSGDILAAEDNDDTDDTENLDPDVDFTVQTEGDYAVGVTDLTGGTGTYQAVVVNQFGVLPPLTPAGQFVYQPAAGSSPVGLTGLPETDLPSGFGTPS